MRTSQASQEGRFERLAQDAGLEFSLDRIEHPAWLAADARHQASWITPLEGQKPSAKSIGAFKRVLRRDEVALVQKICEPIMKRFAYPPVQTPPITRFQERLIRTFRN